jgi:DNA polymerase-3 subunit gamma/tau
VHMLSTGSFNALLKTLEEPPAHVKFLFATTDVQKLPATILSRCQRFDLKRIGPPVIAGHLLHIAQQEGVALSQEAALAVAIGADGGMRDAESMLDQLVAFCGDKIEEKDVLSVFGFTSRQKVSDLCEAVLAEDSSEALQLIHEQAEAGRDLTQLLGDLIGHLRNLLLAQADPGGLEDELGRPVVEALQTQCAGVARERLLELIDLCAAGEQKMKWASNKRMYQEVTLLRAIQTVGQVTLGEVLEALKALREGGALPERVKAERPQKVRLPASTQQNAPVGVPVRLAAKTPTPPKEVALPVVETPHAVPATEEAAPVPEGKLVVLTNETLPISATESNPLQAPGVAPSLPAAEEPVFAFAVATVEEPVSSPIEQPVPEKPAPIPVMVPDLAPVVEKVTPAKVPSKVLEVEALWPSLVERVRKERSFISMWVESGVLDEIRDGVAVFVFAEEQSLAADYISKDGHREFLEGLLLELTGVPLKVRPELRDSVQRRPVAQPPPPVKAVAKDPMLEFKNDPLIRKALEIFKARLEAVQ